MKKSIRIISSVLTILLVFSMASVMATGPTFTITPEGPGNSQAAAETILGFVQWIGYAIAIGMLIYVGIKYVMASANEKADLKNSLVKYVIGAILIAGASAVAGWMFSLGSSIN